MKYIIQERATGNFIEEYETLEEAEYTVQEWEKIDKEFGYYKPNVYEICKIKEAGE